VIKRTQKKKEMHLYIGNEEVENTTALMKEKVGKSAGYYMLES